MSELDVLRGLLYALAFGLALLVASGAEDERHANDTTTKGGTGRARS